LKRRYRVLLIAEAANPEWVSVPLVGWSLANALRAVVDVHIVTQIRNKAALERAGLIEGQHFTAIDNEAVMKPLWKIITAIRGGQGKGWTTVSAIQSLFYPLFEREIWRRFGSKIKDHQFDVVHRITPLTPTSASLLAGRCARAGVPFVIGPLNGGVPWPAEYRRERHKEKEWLSYVRGFYKLRRSIRQTWKKSSAIIAGSLHTASEIPEHSRDKVFYIPENAINLKIFENCTNKKRYDRVSLCFIGRLVPYKGADIAIEAAQDLLTSGAADLAIIGDGPMADELKLLAERLGLTSSITFSGWVEHARIAEHVREKSVFLFPSVREFGGGAIIEAMALGLIPVVVDYGGPGEIVTRSTGFKLEIKSRQKLIEDIRNILSDMALGKYNLYDISQRSLERINRLYTWDKKADQVLELYEWVTGDRKEKPVFEFIDCEIEGTGEQKG